MYIPTFDNHWGLIINDEAQTTISPLIYFAYFVHIFCGTGIKQREL